MSEEYKSAQDVIGDIVLYVVVMQRELLEEGREPYSVEDFINSYDVRSEFDYLRFIGYSDLEIRDVVIQGMNNINTFVLPNESDEPSNRTQLRDTLLEAQLQQQQNPNIRSILHQMGLEPTIVSESEFFNNLYVIPNIHLGQMRLFNRLFQNNPGGYNSFCDGIDEICTICIEYLNNNTPKAIFEPCGHCFHYECAEGWIKKRPNASCPNCRVKSTKIVVFDPELPSRRYSDPMTRRKISRRSSY